MSATLNPRELPLVHELPEDRRVPARVIGVGGAGSAMAGRLRAAAPEGVGFFAADTDARALARTPPGVERFLIGARVTRGLGAGGDPETGAAAAEGDRAALGGLSAGGGLVFLLAGLGGGTGGGAAPAVAAEASKNGAVVIAFATLPFGFEGGRRAVLAEEALVELRKHCDAVVPLANDALTQEAEEGEGIEATLARSDGWVARGVRAVWALLSRPGPMMVDFAALRGVFNKTRGGRTVYGFASGATPRAAAEALDDCPLAVMPGFARKADRLLVGIAGGGGLSLADVNAAMEPLLERFGREAHVTVGASAEEGRADAEIVVLGVSDVGARPRPAARPAAPARAAEEPPRGGARRGRDKAPAAGQDEFEFGTGDAGRGGGPFDRTDRNLFNGEDLDTPTFLRRGVTLAK
jgi:cell division protein FtsZ